MKKIGQINKKKMNKMEMLWKQFSNIKIILLRSWYDLINLVLWKYLGNIKKLNYTVLTKQLLASGMLFILWKLFFSYHLSISTVL